MTASRPASWRTIQIRPIRVSARRSATTTGMASDTLGAVASVRLIRNSARDSLARRAASSARAAWSAARRPMTIPTNSRRSRLSHSSGSLTARVNRGSTNRASYSRNEATAAATAAPVPNTTAIPTTAMRYSGDASGTRSSGPSASATRTVARGSSAMAASRRAHRRRFASGEPDRVGMKDRNLSRSTGRCYPGGGGRPAAARRGSPVARAARTGASTPGRAARRRGRTGRWHR